MSKLIYLAIVILTLTTACEKKNVPEKKGDDKVVWLQQTDRLVVLNETGSPISTAQMLIGNRNSENNWVHANEKGEIIFPSSWKDIDTLTISAPEYLTVTLFNQSPSIQTVKLKKLLPLPQLKVEGDVSGVSTKDKDGIVDFSLVMQSFLKNDILQFDVNKIISPWTENISVAGFDIPLPQNIFLPSQKESYFITVVLEKLNFTLNFADLGIKKISTIRGRFPFKKIISEVQNKKPYYELINYFEMLSSGKTSATLDQNTAKVTLPANQLLFDQVKAVMAPTIPLDQVMLGLNCLKSDMNYSPIDIKYFKSKDSFNLKAVKFEDQYFVGVIKNKNEFDLSNENTERMSLVILPWDTTTNYQFLPLINNPQVSGKNEFHINPPNNLDGLKSLGFTAVISEVKSLTLESGKKVEIKLAKWELHSPQWATKIMLPDSLLPSENRYRFEISFLSQKVDNSRKVDFFSVDWNHESQVENATHITKSAVNF